MKIFSFVGNSNSGKTTLITRIISELRNRNYSVGVIKYCPKGFDVDRIGKDSERFREKGADSVLLLGEKEMVLFEKRNGKHPKQLIEKYFHKNDFAIVEGGKSWKGIEKIEVVGNDKQRLQLDEKPIAVISDKNISTGEPVFKKDDIKNIVNFLEKQNG